MAVPEDLFRFLQEKFEKKTNDKYQLENCGIFVFIFRYKLSLTPFLLNVSMLPGTKVLVDCNLIDNCSKFGLCILRIVCEVECDQMRCR